MAHQLSAAQAKSRLADCLRKAERGESVIITRRGRPIAALVGVDRMVVLPKSKASRASRSAPAQCTLAELVRVLRNGPKPDRGYWQTLVAVTKRQPSLNSPWAIGRSRGDHCVGPFSRGSSRGVQQGSGSLP